MLMKAGVLIPRKGGLLIFIFLLTSCEFAEVGLDQRSNLTQEIEVVSELSQLQIEQEKLTQQEISFLDLFVDPQLPLGKNILLSSLKNLEAQLVFIFKRFSKLLSPESLQILQDYISQVGLQINELSAIRPNALGNLPMEWSFTVKTLMAEKGKAALEEVSDFSTRLKDLNDEILFICSDELKSQSWPLALMAPWMGRAVVKIEEFLALPYPFQEEFEKALLSASDDLHAQRNTNLFLIQTLRRKHYPPEIQDIFRNRCRDEIDFNQVKALFLELKSFQFDPKVFKKIEKRIDSDGNFDLGGMSYPVEKISYDDFDQLMTIEDFQSLLLDEIDFDMVEQLLLLKKINTMKWPFNWIEFQKFKRRINDYREYFFEEVEESKQIALLENRLLHEAAINKLLTSQMAKDSLEILQGMEVNRCLIHMVMLQKESNCLDDFK